jgi:DNA-directed RNA polymerase subunit RPC12/RpoP
MKAFTKNDTGFICSQCKREVPPLGYTSRNHCPFCLYSLHVDCNPGDRMNTCGGLMRPVSADPRGRKGMTVTFECITCGRRNRNTAARDDDGALLIALTVGV